MTSDKQILLSTAYFGPIAYYAHLVNSGHICIETNDHYVKQTWRNRCAIYTANGIQNLSVPVVKINGNHTKVRDIQISDSEKWQLVHWRAIETAYSHSPYFLYYRDDLEPFFCKKYKYLLDLNSKLLETILYLLEFNIKINYSECYIDKSDENYIDLRNAISPKKETTIKFPEYMQVFADKHGFIPNMSILDLLFNEGPQGLEYLQNMKL